MSERYERTDISGGLVARVGGLLALAVALVFVISYGFLHLLDGRTSTPRRTGPDAPAPAWGEPVPADYRWLDRERKIISIPIERAIDLTVERGLPSRSRP